MSDYFELMNIEATAKQIMSARHSDAFTQEACEKILRDNLQQEGGDATCSKAAILTSGSNAAPTVQPAGAAQPKPESWQVIAEEAWNELANCSCSIGSEGETAIILSAIERSHAAKPQPSDQPPREPDITGDMERADRVTSGKDTPSRFELLRPDAEHQRREHWQKIAEAHDCRDLTDAFVQLVKSRQSLLSALAAIEQHNNEKYPTITNWNVRVDLSALRKHDEKLTAEVRKPLLLVLHRIRTAAYGASSVDGNTEQLRLSSIVKRCDNALTKLK